MKIKILIHTLGRINNQLTYSFVPNKLKKNVYFVVSKKEAKSHKKLGRKIIICPLQGKTGLNAVRDWMMEYAYRKGMKYVVMADDDVRFYKTKDTRKIPLRKKSFYKILNKIEKYLKDYVQVGLLPRWQFHKGRTNPVINSRLICFVGYNVKAFHKSKAKFTKDMTTPTLGDVNISLQLLTSGYQNLMITKYAFESSKVNSEGGCSTYRTYKMSKRAAKDIEKAYPDFAKAIERKGGSWENFGKKSKYVSTFIRWKKAYKSSKHQVFLR